MKRLVAFMGVVLAIQVAIVIWMLGSRHPAVAPDQVAEYADAGEEGASVSHVERSGGPGVPVPACSIAGTVLTCPGAGKTLYWEAGVGGLSEGGAMTPFEVDNGGYSISYPVGITAALATSVTTTGSTGSIVATASILLQGNVGANANANFQLLIDTTTVDFVTVTAAQNSLQTIVLTGAIVGSLAAGSHTLTVNVEPFAAMDTPAAGGSGVPAAVLTGFYSGQPSGGGGGGGGSFTAGGDLSGSSSSQQVIGLKTHALPSLSTGFLEWNGSAWAFASAGSENEAWSQVTANSAWPGGSVENIIATATITPTVTGHLSGEAFTFIGLGSGITEVDGIIFYNTHGAGLSGAIPCGVFNDIFNTNPGNYMSGAFAVGGLTLSTSYDLLFVATVIGSGNISTISSAGAIHVRESTQ